MKYRDVARKLSKLECHEIRQRSGGSHRKWFNPETNKTTVIPDWGSRDIKLGTLKAAIKQLGIDWTIFEQV
ncbi:type II toxin-antitoxin system HicA family toxin [Synechococcus sp. PCC 6312]|uniref:type II toxin-antitoxin system HicA family toxin n=1 Tax=Synechococcus sp. (strain ATCC 27167 / PCC 6312) TaxID=195253 RepID=UPI00029ED4BE|nr:putative periplasmic or secreted lipoprotein [Synechococcus sp. PCC 6312]